MLKSIYCGNNLYYSSPQGFEERLIFMDPAIGWFQPEQKGPSLTLWTEIWDSHQRTENIDFPIDARSADLSVFNGTSFYSIEDRKTLKKNESSINFDCSSVNRGKRRDNKASTYNLDRSTGLISKYGGIPWMPKNRTYSFGIVGLHEEIEDFYHYMSPKPAEHNIRLEVVERITKIILSIWPHAQVEVYGSFRTGLYLPTSDIDLVVIEKKDVSFSALEKALLNNNIAKADSIKVLDKASVPIVKLTDAKTDTKIDISFNMNNGVKSANLIKDFMQAYPALPKLVLVLKQFLLQRDLNEVFLGGISSYSLILLTISFLQHVGNHNETNLGRLLILFFEFYGVKFNYRETGISIKNGGTYFTKGDFNSVTDGNRPSILCIEDPLLPGNDIGRSSYGALIVKQAFAKAYDVLNKAIHPGYCDGENKSILGRIIQITDEVVEYRKWVNDTFPVENTVNTNENQQVASGKENVMIGQCNDSTSHKKVICGSGSLDSQSSTNSSCLSLGSGSSASSMTSDTDSDFTADILLKLDVEADTGPHDLHNQDDLSIREKTCRQPSSDAALQVSGNSETVTSSSFKFNNPSDKILPVSSDKAKPLRSNSKTPVVNSSWVKQRKFTPNPQNNVASSVNGSKNKPAENLSVKSNICYSSNAAKKKPVNRKDSLNTNISRKDGQVIFGR